MSPTVVPHTYVVASICIYLSAKSMKLAAYESSFFYSSIFPALLTITSKIVIRLNQLLMTSNSVGSTSPNIFVFCFYFLPVLYFTIYFTFIVLLIIYVTPRQLQPHSKSNLIYKFIWHGVNLSVKKLFTPCNFAILKLSWNK